MPMDIHVASSLTPDDEEGIAPKVVEALRGVLDRMPIAYAIRVETVGQHVLQFNAAPGRLRPEESLDR
jgi:hypothetical protein